MSILRRFNSDERGASAVEYIVALILCCMVVIGVNKLFGDTLRKKFEMSNNQISQMDEPEKGPSGSKDGDGSGGDGSGGASKSSGASGASAASAKGGSEGGGAGAGGRGGSGEGGVSVIDKGNKVANPDDPGGYVQGFEEEKRAGFNPLLLLIFLGLGGMLFYVMYKGNKG